MSNWFYLEKNKYPENTRFLFEGYHGFEDKEKLALAIRSQAIKDGTSFWVMPKKVNKSNISQYLIICPCQHAGQDRKPKKESITNELQFAQGKLQAEGTIIMHAHDASIETIKLKDYLWSIWAHNNRR